MGLKEISLAQLLNNTSGSDYFPAFAKLIGHSENSIFYEGITDDDYDLLEQLESKLKYELPSNYLEFLGVLNGGKFLNVILFSLAENEYPNSLYSVNFYSNIRDNLKSSYLVVGKYDNYIMYIDCEDVDGLFTLMDIRNNEKINFQSFESLIGFLFYILIVSENKKAKEEKEQIVQIKEKLHTSIKLREGQLRKDKEKNAAKLRAKTAAKALKEKIRKSRR